MLTRRMPVAFLHELVHLGEIPRRFYDLGFCQVCNTGGWFG
jgi:hypothetical protein